MAAYVQDSQFMTRRGAVFLAIIALHLFVIWALATGLARRAVELVAPPIQTDIVEEVKKEDQPPPPPPPEMERPPVEVPPPDINIDVPVESNTTAITDTTNQHVAPAPPVQHTASVPPTGIGPARGLPATDDYYPSSARRLGQEGLVNINLCVGPDGKLSQPPTVIKGSGTASLDEAAIKWANASSGHWRPATEDGKPISKCSQLPVRFQLK
jgi:periplasmic protein TonB